MNVGLRIIGSATLPSNEYYRHKVVDLETAMIQEFGNGGTDDIAPVSHYHCEGNYAREIFIAKGTCMIGKIHKHEHINVLSAGHCYVVTEAGREELRAPKTFISSPGIKRAVYAIEDTVWTTIHPTDSIDLEEIESEVIAKSYEELDRLLGVKS